MSTNTPNYGHETQLGPHEHPPAVMSTDEARSGQSHGHVWRILTYSLLLAVIAGGVLMAIYGL